MAGFIIYECGAERGGGNSDSDFEDGGDDGWRPRIGRGRDAGRGREANRIGRGGENNLYYSNKQATGGRVGALRRSGGRVTFPDLEGEFQKLSSCTSSSSESESINCRNHPYHHHDIFIVEDDGSDSSDVELVELPAGSISERGSRGGNGRVSGRGVSRREGRSNTGEGTSRGPGELGSNFNPSKNQTNKHQQKQTNQTST